MHRDAPPKQPAHGPQSASQGTGPSVPGDGGTQGYLALATGPRKYVELAMNLAASIKVVDPSRRVCLVHDRNTDIPEEARHLFDDFAVLTDDPVYRPILNKLRLFEFSPYDRSMFVDADCLLVRRDVSHYWQRCAGHPFVITGQVMTSGVWKGNAISELMARYQAQYVVKMNSGVFYFDKSAAAQSFFHELNAFYRDHSENLVAHDGPWKYEDELFFGVVMGRVGMPPVLQNEGPHNTIMATTWRAPICLINPDRGRSVLYKPRGFYFGIPVLPRGFDRLSPTFVHFVGLKPKRLYERLSRRFRATVAARRTS